MGTTLAWYDVRFDGNDIGNLCAAAPDIPVSDEEVERRIPEMPLPDPKLIIQPPGGRTLVNFDTIFYTETVPEDTEVDRFGIRDKRVTLIGTPTTYTFHWGRAGQLATDPDPDPLATSDPGAAYPDHTIVHRYNDKDASPTPWVEITYSFEYQVGDGDMRPLGPTRTVRSDTRELELFEARPHLVG